MNQVGTPEILISENDLIRIPRIVGCLTRFKKSGLSARAYTRLFNEEEAKKAPEDRLFEKPLHHQTLLAWKKQFTGSMKTLVRAKRKKPPVEKSLLSSMVTGRQLQFDFILGCVGTSRINKIELGDKYAKEEMGNKYIKEILGGSKSLSLAKAHEWMVEATPFAKWGEPMTRNMLYRDWQKLPPAYRDAILKSKSEAYEEMMVYLPKPKGPANEEWQMDELEFDVKGFDRETGEEKIVTIYCVACVDTATGYLRHIEVSEHRIDKMTYLRAWKRSLRGNRRMGVAFCARPLTLRMDGASIHEKKPSKNPHKINDLRESALATNVALLWNKPHSKRENAVVENFNGNFKRDLVLKFTMFVREIAPAMNAGEWVTHLVAFEEQINDFGKRWNTAPQRDGTSRLEKVMSTLVEGSLDITEEQIDRAVRYTISRSFWEGVVVEGKIYYNSTLIHKQCRRILVRVRPDGPGPDVEAYSRGEHIGTLYRQGDDANMPAGNNSASKAFIDRCYAENEKRNRRFKDTFEQLAVDGAPFITPQQREIILRKRGLDKASETPPETQGDAPLKDTSRDESTGIGQGWTGGKL